MQDVLDIQQTAPAAQESCVQQDSKQPAPIFSLHRSGTNCTFVLQSKGTCCRMLAAKVLCNLCSTAPVATILAQPKPYTLY